VPRAASSQVAGLSALGERRRRTQVPGAHARHGEIRLSCAVRANQSARRSLRPEKIASGRGLALKPSDLLKNELAAAAVRRVWEKPRRVSSFLGQFRRPVPLNVDCVRPPRFLAAVVEVRRRAALLPDRWRSPASVSAHRVCRAACGRFLRERTRRRPSRDSCLGATLVWLFRWCSFLAFRLTVQSAHQLQEPSYLTWARSPVRSSRRLFAPTLRKIDLRWSWTV
jgi:hypothetical protein